MAAQRADEPAVRIPRFRPGVEDDADLMHPFVAHVALDPWFALDLVVFLFQQHVLFDRPVGNGVGVVRFQLVVATGAPESKIEKKR